MPQSSYKEVNIWSSCFVPTFPALSFLTIRSSSASSFQSSPVWSSSVPSAFSPSTSKGSAPALFNQTFFRFRFSLRTSRTSWRVVLSDHALVLRFLSRRAARASSFALVVASELAGRASRCFSRCASAKAYVFHYGVR